VALCEAAVYRWSYAGVVSRPAANLIDAPGTGESAWHAWRLLEALGLRDLSLQLNSIGDAECRPAYVEQLRAYYSDKLGQVCSDCRDRFARNPLRLLDCKTPVCQPVIAGAPVLHILGPNWTKEPQTYDLVLVAVGRSPNGKTIGAEAAGVAVAPRGFLPVARQARPNVPPSRKRW